MEFRLLGQVEVVRAGRPIVVASEKERALLALLLLHANEVVSGDELVEGLWSAPPRTAVHAVEVYVSRLRHRLGENGARIVTHHSGYWIEVDPDLIDLHRFQQLVGVGRQAQAAGDHAAAAVSFRAALALWRGTPLSDLAAEPFADHEAARLEELWLSTLEATLEAELALGRHQELIAELEAQVAEHPHNEHLAAQLMLALYRSGRQVDALAVYQSTRRRLHAQLGLEPSRELRGLEQAILKHDPSLELPPDGAAPTVSRTSRRKTGLGALARRRLVVAGVVVLAAATAFAAVGIPPFSGSPAPTLKENSVGILDPLTGKILQSIPVSFAPGAIAARPDAAWVVAPTEGTVSEIGRSSGEIVQTTHVGEAVGAIAVDGGAAWVTRPLDSRLARIDLSSGRVSQLIDVGVGATGIAYGYGSVWVALPAAHTVSRLDPRTGRVIAAVHMQIAADELVTGEGGVWASSELDGTIVEIDPTVNQVIRAINVGNGPSGLAAGNGALWVANTSDGTVSRIDPVRGVVRSTVPVGAAPSALAVAPGAVWVADETKPALVRLSPFDGSVLGTIPLPSRPNAIASDGATLAVSLAAGGTAHRGGIARVMATVGTIRSLDPSLAIGAADWAVQSIVGDGLVTFRRAGGTDGVRLAADLAVALPAPLDNGTIYSFRLRDGVHFSTGNRLRPRDVRYTIERLFRAHSPSVYLFAGIIGADRCHRPARTCDLATGIQINKRANTVTFHLRAPDPYFLVKLALPSAYIVPAGSPLPSRDRTVAGTGPYRIGAYQPQQSLTLVRNPWFSPWASAVRPDGYPDRIVVRLVASTTREETAAVERVEQGLVDLAVLPPRTPNAPEHEHRYPARMHVWRAPPAPLSIDGHPLTKAVSKLVFLSARVRNYQQSPVFGPLLDQLWVR